MTAESSAWGAYIDAVLRIETPGGVVWLRRAPVSQTSGEYPEPEGRAICVVTAHNPGGQLVSDAENASAQLRLEAELEARGLTWWPAAGGDASWTHVEASAAVIGLTEVDATALGAQFGQEAIFMLTPAERLIVGCAERRIAMTGWALEGEEGDEDGDDEGEEGDSEEDAESSGTVVEVAVYEEKFLTEEKAGGFRDFDDYLDWVGRREGLLCTLRCPEGAVTLHGDGRGGVLIGGEWGGAEGPFSVSRALACLAEAGVFGSDLEAESAAWGPGDIAALVSVHGGNREFTIDGLWWSGTTPGSLGDARDPVLAMSRWEFTGGGWAAPDGSDWGTAYLLRIGPRHIVRGEGNGAMIHDDWDALDNEAAVAKFMAYYGPTPEAGGPA